MTTSRIVFLAWLEPEKYADDESYQQLNSVMAIGSGQLSGKGYNNDATTSVKNGNFVSEPQTDFIFAIIGEELGFVGCCGVIFLLLLIVIQCILNRFKSEKIRGGRIICGGVAALIGIQSFINISVATLILPNTGLFASLCQLRTYIRRMFLYGNRTRFKCRITA